MTIRVILAFMAIILFPSCQPDPKRQESNLDELLTDIEASENRNSPQDSLGRGYHLKGAFGKQTSNRFKEQKVVLDSLIKRIEKLPETTLNDEINKSVLTYKIQNLISEIEFKRYYIPLNAEGGFYNWIGFSLSSLPFHSVDDYEAYLKWLPKYVVYLRENRQLLKEGMFHGIVASTVVANNTLSLLKPWISTYKPPSPFSEPLHHIYDKIDSSQAQVIISKMNILLAEEIYPAYDSLYDFIKNDYLPACADEVGVYAIENGSEYYKNRVVHFTTLPLTPDSVFNLGLAEVDRIMARMEEIKKESGFDGTMDQYIHYLRTDKRFYAQSPDELLHYAAWLSKKAEAKLPTYFDYLYTNPFTVEPVPKAIAPNYTVGRYSPGSLKQNKPGAYWVNTYNLSSRPLYAFPALTLHEAVPGHHLHHAITEELSGIPEFRKTFYISAFGEGWGLYSEYLGEEMGMYQSPEEWFGRYTYEMWRACRLVVDVGMHDKGWSRQDAVDYLARHTALSMHEINTEIDRYIGWPGQAISYKIGELKIKNLRSIAEDALGDAFDIGEFHNMILSQGSVPLPMLDNMVAEWIEQQKASN